MASSAPAAPAAPAAIAQVEQFLADVLASAPALTTADYRGRGRPPVLPAVCLWAGLLVCVLRGLPQVAGLHRLLTVHGLWSYPRVRLSSQALHDRLAHGGLAPLQTLFAHVTAVLRDQPRPPATRTLARFAREVYALDETTLDKVARALPATDPAAPHDRRLPGKLAVRFDVRRQLFDHVQFHPRPRQNEKVAAPDLVAALPPGCLLLFDLGYFSFGWLDALTDAGQHWVTRLRGATSYQLAHTFYDDGVTSDRLIWLGAHRADRARHQVRLVQFPLGATTAGYLTNVVDPARLSLDAIAGLYQRRWDIELAFHLLKTHLGVALLWSSDDTRILQQVWAALIIAQVAQALRQTLAVAAAVDPFAISLPLLLELAPAVAARGGDVIAELVECGRLVGLIRPSRRTVNRAPVIPLTAYALPPPDWPTERRPRYAHKA